MSDALKLGFGPFAAPAKGAFSSCSATTGSKFGPATAKALGSAAGLVARAAKAERFTGKSGSALELIVPEGLKVARLVVIGAGKTAGLEQKDLLKLGGLAMGKLPLAASEATVFAELPGGALKAEQAADLAQGVRAARLCLRPLQDQAQGRREAARQAQRDRRGRRRRRRAQRLCDRARRSATAC